MTNTLMIGLKESSLVLPTILIHLANEAWDELNFGMNFKTEGKELSDNFGEEATRLEQLEEESSIVRNKAILVRKIRQFLILEWLRKIFEDENLPGELQFADRAEDLWQRSTLLAKRNSGYKATPEDDRDGNILFRIILDEEEFSEHLNALVKNFKEYLEKLPSILEIMMAHMGITT